MTCLSILSRRTPAPVAALLLFGWAVPAAAAQVAVGVYRHGVDLPTSLYSAERGYDLQLSYRFGRVAALKDIGAPSPYLIASINSRGDTSFGGAGLAWTIGHKVYVRPAIGLVVTGRSARRYQTDPASGHFRDRIDLGSPILLEPELAIGLHISPRVAIEASWTHISHATLFSLHNPGLDMLGARAVFRLP